MTQEQGSLVHGWALASLHQDLALQWSGKASWPREGVGEGEWVEGRTEWGRAGTGTEPQWILGQACMTKGVMTPDRSFFTF